MTKSDPSGQKLSPIDPVKAAELFGASLVREVTDRDLAGMTDAIVSAIEHPGFAHIRVHQACPSWKIW